MAKSTVLRWTDKQKEIAELLRQGKDAKDIIASGYADNTVFKVQRALKKGGKGNQPDKPAPDRSSSPPLPQSGRSQTPPPDPAFVTRYRIESSEPVTVGAIQALPEDWRLTQHGFFLLLDTYYLTKAEIGYEGTMGEFLTDMGRLYRALMQYSFLPEVGPQLPEQNMIKEESNDGDGAGTSTGEGAGRPG